MKKIILMLESYLNKSTDGERNVILQTLSSPREVSEMDIHSLASKCYCSPATIVRLTKKMGFGGFKQYKLALINYLSYSESMKYSSDQMGDRKIENETENFAVQTIKENIEALKKIELLLDYNIINQVSKMIVDKEYIYVFGIGQSYLIARDFADRLTRFNKKCFINQDHHMQRLVSKNVPKDSVCFIFSYSGETDEMIEVAKNIKEQGVPTVAVLKYGITTLAEIADYNMFVPPLEYEMRIGSSTGRICQLILADLLLDTIIKETYDEMEYEFVNINDIKLYSRKPKK